MAYPRTATVTELIDSWLRGVDETSAANALLALGARSDHLAAVLGGPGYPPGPEVVDWALTPEEFHYRAIAPPLAVAGALPIGTEPVWRLAVRGDFDLASIVEKLLRSPLVSSAFVAVDRPPGSLRRRPWRWPLRVGLAGFPAGTEDELWEQFVAEHQVLPRLLGLTRIEDEPAAVDVLFVPGPLPSAIAVLHEYEPVANAVLVVTDAAGRWPVVASELAAARALTAAVAAGVVRTDDLLQSLTGLVVELSHAKHFDVAVTTAFDRRVLLTAEADGMARSALPETTRRAARAARAAALAAPTLARRVEAAAGTLDALADGMFAGESHEATSVVDPTEEIVAALAQVEQERWLQASVSSPENPNPGAFRRGRNDVAVFIGPEVAGAVAAPTPFDDSQLPWEDDVEAFRLTVAFVPLRPFRPPQEAELELPRFGRTPKDATFVLDVPLDDHGNLDVAARIVVLFRNRVLQTAVLRGKVDQPVELADATAVLPTLSGLDDRRPFDVALLANHAAGVEALIRHSSGHTFVALKEVLQRNAERLGRVLGDAVRLQVRKGLDSDRARKLLIELAKEGRDFYGNLGAAVGGLSGADRIQLVTASSEWLLPIELVYERYAPLPNAKVCNRYLEGAVACGKNCAPEKDRSIVCPNAFWGLSKTIERHHFEPGLEDELNRRVLVLKNPRAKRRTLNVDRGILATSKLVVSADRKSTLGVLGAKATETIGWKAYTTALDAADVQLLVLMPHTDYREAPSMEIDGEPLERSFIEPEYVTGGRDVDPVVVLFGCATSGNPDDPAGFASRFCEKGAAVVFHSSAQLLNTHAVQLSQRLAQLLNAGGRSRPLSDVLSEFRSQAIRDGLVAAFAVYAFGDADWRI